MYPVRPLDPAELRGRVREIELELKTWQKDFATSIEFEENTYHRCFTIVQSRALQLSSAEVEDLLYRAYLQEDIQYFTQNNFVRLLGTD